MFLINSRLGLFTAACFHKHPFSRSYGVILPSSLTRVRSLTLGCSPRLPVSVIGTGPDFLTIEAFLGSVTSVDFALRASASPLKVFARRICLPDLLTAYTGIQSPAPLRLLRPSICKIRGTGISTCCPSTTPFGLALGPDLPRADEPSPGTLSLSVDRILTYLSLLTPAFSLLIAPLLLPVQLLRH